MTQKQMIETIQQLFPGMGDTQIRDMINSAVQEMAEELDLYVSDSSSENITIVEGQVYYPLSADVVAVIRAEVNNKQISKISGELIIDNMARS